MTSCSCHAFENTFPSATLAIVLDDISNIWYVGELQIGQISFDMMLNINTSMKPNFTELAESIAHELEVDISQVELSHFIFWFMV